MTRDARSLLPLIMKAAAAAAEIIREAEPTRAELDWQEKSPVDFVTKVDLAAEERIIKLLRAAEPAALFLAEESPPPALTPDPPPLLFVIDPLDGTTNFLHGIPEYAVSIAAVVDGVLEAGVVLNVPRNECFSAVRGGGAWLGETPLHVSKITLPQRALIGTGFPFKDSTGIPLYLEQMARVMRATSGIRRPGAASIDLASVAAGRLDAFWENSLSPWDIAAGVLLIREAGGVCTDLEGQDSQVAFGPIVAGNKAMHAWLLEQLNTNA